MAKGLSKAIVSVLVTMTAFSAALSWSQPCRAEGALAIGLPPDVARGGYASGYSYNAKTEEDARASAMKFCRESPTNEKARSLCKVIQTFSRKCVALSMDPKAGTPGVGWGIGDDLAAAERQAVARCVATAGPSRRAACKVSNSACDGVLTAADRCDQLSGDEAIAACNEAIQKDPQAAANYMDRGFEYRNKGDGGRAMADYNKAIELNPKYVKAYNNRGLAYSDDGKDDKALADFSKTIELDPKYTKAYLNRGIIYLFSGNSDRALADINQASEIDPKDAFLALWVDIVNKRSKLQSRLPQGIAQLDMTKWPAPVIRLFLGQMTPGAVLAAADDPDAGTKMRRVCDANFFNGELALQQGNKEEATRLFRLAATACPKERTSSMGAIRELMALGIKP